MILVNPVNGRSNLILSLYRKASLPNDTPK
jgi:hypothetical protein